MISKTLRLTCFVITFLCKVNVVITLGATPAFLNDVIRHKIVANRTRKRFPKTARVKKSRFSLPTLSSYWRS